MKRCVGLTDATNWEAPLDSEGPFPLTPALSPRERESVWPLVRSSEVLSFAFERATLLPLPEGEGEEAAEVSFASLLAACGCLGRRLLGSVSSTRKRNRGEASTGTMACAMPSSKRLPGWV